MSCRALVILLPSRPFFVRKIGDPIYAEHFISFDHFPLL
jgi:hypothetical protein